ncbi:MAG: sulfite exporter TauE/SafE family protein [Clostridiales bacterium]|nr:sulfite exporter TauE/SafE family protein [Clostridiales bacterium]MDY3745536.1 sulfite exporter TauE/SafE family protein [Lachnospiraceae bacterium]
MLSVLLFFVCLLASSIGAVVGAGGGVIIKPVLDMLGVLPVSTVSFCAGCTVLGMSLCSLVRNRHDGVKLQIKTSTALAIGAVGGGLLGKWLFELVRNGFGDERMLGAIQAICLTLITFGVFLYICNKNKLPSMHVNNLLAAVVIGVFLGVISSFLGIGGGTSNVAVLFFFFSMDAKEAAKNSLYIIIFSQISSIFTAIVTGSVPSFEVLHLISMIFGGIGGALTGAAISKKIDNRGVEKILKILLLALVALDFYNVIKYIFI